jgi:hypothetical protein
VGHSRRDRAWASIGRAAALAVLVTAVLVAPPRAQASFQLGLQDPGFEASGTSAQVAAASSAMNAVDGSVVRVAVPWAQVAPAGSARPANFDAADPADPHYRWAATDYAVRAAAQHHLRVILQILDAPVWAEGPGQPRPYVSAGAWNPDPGEFSEFIHAAALRYSGAFPDPIKPGAKLPRVSYWEPWNEPNIPGYFSAPHPIDAYRTLLDRAYATLKAIHRDNLVVLGGLAPVSPVPGSTPPLDFGAQLLCLHRVGNGFRPNRSCPQRAEFDVFGIHPYSLAATPTKHAYKPGDVLVGDMGEVGALVRAANAFHTAVPAGGHQIWATEFAWFTNPPNSQLGDSDATAARYVAYSMYEMWRSGVSLVSWFTVLDTASADIGGGGLYSSSGRPKLMLRAFAFPFVASTSRTSGFAWGRVPLPGRVWVTVQRGTGRGWRTVGRARTTVDRTFSVRFRADGSGVYRARVIGGPTSLPYDSRPIPPKRTHLFTFF